MRYAIFSDVHANRQAWEAVLADMERMQVDTLVCLGDVVGYGPKPQEVLAAVREVTPNFVLGNHDAAACGRLDPSIFNERARIVIEWTRDQLDEDSMEFLGTVPLQMDGPGVQFVHAEMIEPGEFGYVDGPGPAESNLRAMTERIAFIGHTHLPLSYSMPRKGGQVSQAPPIDFQLERGRRYLVNVGSVGEPRTTDVRASYVIYDDTERAVTYRKVAFDVDAYRADLEEVGLDICPYFVQVVDANRQAGAVPEAAPQLALAELPAVAEVVTGHQGRLIVGTPAGGQAWGSGAGSPTARVPTPVVQPRAFPVGLIVTLSVFLLACVGALVTWALRDKGDQVATQAGEEAAEAPAADEESGEGPRKALEPLVGLGPIKNLELRFFEGPFDTIEDLRKAAEEESAGKKSSVPDGLLSLERAVRGKEGVGLVWEGRLAVPESGNYDFELDAGGASALLIYWDEVAVLEEVGAAGRTQRARVKLRKGHAPIRVEFLRGGAEQALSLRWSGPGLDGRASLVSSDSASPATTVAGDPAPAEPADVPPAKREPADELSEDLESYWSFDRRTSALDPKRFTRNDDGSLTEKLVHAGERIRYLVPKRDRGAGWVKVGFDDSDWTEGRNGVGYEERPGDFADLIKSKIGGQPKKHPHTVYLRITFEVEDLEVYEGLALMMSYDDGFIAHLNGNQIASRNAPRKPRWNSGATASNEDKKAKEFEAFKITRSLRYLKKGKNVLAIQGLNNGGPAGKSNNNNSSSDMLVLPELVALRNDDGPEVVVETAAEDEEVPSDRMHGEVTQVEGRFKDALSFAGEGSVELGSAGDYSPGTDSFTISLWFTREVGSADGEARRLLSTGAGGDRHPGWALWLTKDVGAVNFVVGNGESRATVSAEHGSLADGKWHHVAAVVERPSGLVQIFVDGSLVVDQRVGLLKGADIRAEDGLSIGRNANDRQHHRGKIDDLAIWNRALAPEEIERIAGEEMALGELFAE